MKEIAELHQQIDAMNGALARASAKNGYPVSCLGKHCCACCYEPVYCSSAEVQHLVEALTPEQRAAVTERLKLVLAKARASGILDLEMPPVMQYLALKLPCPLLEFGVCIAYDRRPVGCRTHLAVGPSEWCDDERRAHQKYPMAKEHSLASGHAIIEAHLKLGNIIHNDNLFALLENELLGEYHETASAEQVQLT